MSNTFTLASFREEVDKEFAPLKIELSDGTEAVLKGLLRLDDKKREQVLELVKTLNSKDDTDDDDDDGVDNVLTISKTASQVLELVSDQGKKLVKELDGDIQLMLKIITTWMGSTQLGEAENSPT
jgi:hypothetical protein